MEQRHAGIDKELTYYARIMPAVVSWPTAVLALRYCFGSLIVRQMRLSKLDTAFLLICGLRSVMSSIP